MDEILDSNFQRPDEQNITYGGFGPRLGALILDGLIVGLPSFALNYLDIVYWKSSAILILFGLIGIVYKPYMEFQFGATLGKMAVNLKVVNLDFGKPNLTEVIVRNIFNIGTSVFSLITTIMVFNLPEFQEISGYMEYVRLASLNKNTNYITWISFLIILIEFICLVSDKKRRSLHDRMGKTYVIVKPQH